MIASKAMERICFMALDPFGILSVAHRALARESIYLYTRRDIRPPFFIKDGRCRIFRKRRISCKRDALFRVCVVGLGGLSWGREQFTGDMNSFRACLAHAKKRVSLQEIRRFLKIRPL